MQNKDHKRAIEHINRWVCKYISIQACKHISIWTHKHPSIWVCKNHGREKRNILGGYGTDDIEMVKKCI